MKSIEFINEAEIQKYKATYVKTPYINGYQDITKIIGVLKKHCSESIPMLKSPIFRGMSNHSTNALIIDPSTGIRRSQNTSNHYTELMDHSPYFADYPKRSRSLVCTTSLSKAAQYGHGGTYLIFPFNGAKIAVCPDSDIWATEFSIPEIRQLFRGRCALKDFNRFLQENGFPDNYEGMVAYVDTPKFADSPLVRFLTRHEPKERHQPIVDNLKADLIPLIQKAMAPEQTGFELLSVPEFISRSSEFANTRTGNPREVWVGSKVLAVNYELLEELHNACMEMGLI